MPAVVFVAPYLDRSARVVCPECRVDAPHSRTAAAQAAAREHNLREHPDSVLSPTPKENP